MYAMHCCFFICIKTKLKFFKEENSNFGLNQWFIKGGYPCRQKDNENQNITVSYE